jgi:hypothetical protein
MGCVICGRSMRTTYVGDGKRAYRGDYCYKCGKIAINKKLKI